MSFSKRPGCDAVCYTKPLDSLKNWNNRFFWVDAFACPAFFLWNTSKGVPKNPFPKSFEFNVEHFATLVALPAPFHKYPEPFLCLVGISHYYTLDEDAYPEFLGDNDEEMDLLSFIRTADPTKVSVAERQRVENEPRLLESTVRRVVPLLPIAPARASSELEASVDKLLMRGIVGMDKVLIFSQKIAVADASGPSHLPKKLREDYGALGGASTTAEVDFIVRSSASAIATVTTVTATTDADATADRALVAPSLFGVGSSSTSRTDSVPYGFSDVSGSDFLIRGIRTVVDPDSDLQKVYVPQWSATNGFGLDDSRICSEIEKRKLRTIVDEQAELLMVRDGEIESLKAQLLLKEAKAAKAIHLRAEVFKYKAAEKSLRGEVGGFKRSERYLREREKNELNVKVIDVLASVKVREQEVADLDAQVTAVKLQNDNLVDQRLQIVNFSLIAELKSNKDASVDTIMSLLCLDDALAERLGLTESQPHANQLMVSIHHSPDQRVVGASALSLSLDVSHSPLKKMRENIAKHVSALRGMFVPLSEPLSAATLEGTKGTSGSTHDTTTTLSVTFVSASTIPPISTDDYEVAHADGQGVPVGMTRPPLLRTLAFFLMLATQS
nr:hypothetical protein [Tanacetum cinerariifolium]